MRLILLGGPGAGKSTQAAGVGPVEEIRDRVYAALPNGISAGTG
jgi:hypothetical protein